MHHEGHEDHGEELETEELLQRIKRIERIQETADWRRRGTRTRKDTEGTEKNYGWRRVYNGLMADTFRLSACPLEARGLFDHAVAQARYGASVFWIRPGLLIGETVEAFVVSWQVKRGGAKRGIVEVVS